jgi:hypothetical protein
MKKSIYLCIVSIVFIFNNSIQASSHTTHTRTTGHGTSSFLPLRPTSREIASYFAAMRNQLPQEIYTFQQEPFTPGEQLLIFPPERTSENDIEMVSSLLKRLQT